jgi:hypothetical protein
MRMQNAWWMLIVGMVGALLAAGAAVASNAGGLPACQADLAACLAELHGAFPATGQTTCWDSSGNVIACAGTGQDGDIRAGAALSYTDNGDGTITDNNTGLMWEKQSADGTIHDKENTYTWDDAFAIHIAGLNAGAGFAGHTDWRLPNGKELQSIVNYENVDPALSPVFNTGCVASCTVLTCSCTRLNTWFWSSTTYEGQPTRAWFVDSNDGIVYNVDKAGSLYVRAVRGGQ